MLATTSAARVAGLPAMTAATAPRRSKPTVRTRSMPAAQMTVHGHNQHDEPPMTRVAIANGTTCQMADGEGDQDDDVE